MKNRWKKLALILGISLTVISMNGVSPAKAAELPEQKEEKQQEENQPQKEQKEEKQQDEELPQEEDQLKEEENKLQDEELPQKEDQLKEKEEKLQDEELPQEEKQEKEAAELLEPTNLHWTENGTAVFYNPNERVMIKPYLYGPRNEEWKQKVYGKGDVELDFSFRFTESGTYTYKIEMWLVDKEEKRISESKWGTSDSFTYTKPDVQLPVPVVTVSEPGTVSAKLPDGEASGCVLGEDYEINYFLYKGPEPSDDTYVGEGNEVGETCTFTVEGDYSDYYVTAKAWSNKINKCKSSAESNFYSLKDGSVYKAASGGSSDHVSRSSDRHSNDSSSDSDAINQEWKPSTPDEAERYAAYGREAVNFTADANNGYAVTVQNAMQGKKCYDSFKAVLGDYSIGRTYNIFPSGAPVYKTDGKARITLNIPGTLRVDKREFKMICVTEKGLPVILEDIDSDPKTITFETDTYYAFALIYK